MSNLNILISGSGIAASVFAFWLLRAYPDANITIVERDACQRLTGASIDIRNSAVDIIKWMNAEEEIRRRTTKEEGIQFVRSNGSAVATFLATGRSDVQSVTSEYEIFRGELAKIFMDPIKDRVEFIYDESVEKYEQQGDGVVVSFVKSKESKKYDLLVAADGFGSKIRGMMFNSTTQEHVHGVIAHCAYFTIKKDLLQGSRLARWYTATGGRNIFLRPDPNPAGHTRGNLINVTANGDTKTKERLNNAIRDGNESYMKLMEETFSDAGWLAPEVLKGMRESDDFTCSLFAQIRAPKIHNGHLVLVGDAGYATPGFGTSLAIIGGYVLAGELLSHPGDVKTALERYAGIMVPFVKSSQGDGSLGLQLLNPQTGLGIGVRNLILGFVTLVKLDKLGMAVASALGFVEKKVPLPDYPWPSA